MYELSLDAHCGRRPCLGHHYQDIVSAGVIRPGWTVAWRGPSVRWARGPWLRGPAPLPRLHPLSQGEPFLMLAALRDNTQPPHTTPSPPPLPTTTNHHHHPPPLQPHPPPPHPQSQGAVQEWAATPTDECVSTSPLMSPSVIPAYNRLAPLHAPRSLCG